MSSTAGALTQVGARGIANQYLDINPEKTFFKQEYLRPTMFAIAEADIPFQGSVQWGKSAQTEIPRNGDALGQIYAKITFPKLLSPDSSKAYNDDDQLDYWAIWADYAAYTALEYAEMEIGSQIVDRIHGYYMVHQSILTRKAGKSIRSLVGPIPQSNLSTDPLYQDAIEFSKVTNITHAPLPFYNGQNPANFIPTIALTLHVIKLKLVFRPLKEMICYLQRTSSSSDAGIPVFASIDSMTTLAVVDSTFDAVLVVNWVYFDLPERQANATKRHDYLTTQTQAGSTVAVEASKSNSSIQVPLYYNHPVKEIVWAYLDNARRDRNRWTDFSVPDSYDEDELEASRLDPFQAFGLKINGVDRVAKREAIYFRSVVPLEHHSSIPDGRFGEFVYAYAFAYEPENYIRPTGSLNFSRLDSANAIYYMSNLKGRSVGSSGDTGTGGDILQTALSHNMVTFQGGLFSMKLA